MSRRPAPPTTVSVLLGVALAVLACDGRELTVFAVFAQAGADTGGTAGAGGAGTPSAAGEPMAPPAWSSGSSTGGSAVGAGSASNGGVGGVPSAWCKSTEECSPGWLCDKPACLSMAGSCVPWPAICSSNPDPVCGCDGVTYWNDCIRLRSEAQRGHPGQCRTTASACETAGDCRVPYASCSHLLGLGDMCGRGLGACWVLPPQCEPSVDSKMWRECKPSDTGPPDPCVDTCRAIVSERFYVELPPGDTCN